MNKNNIFYVPIMSLNLGHYFSKACICPVKYLKERNFDIQNIFDFGILLSKSKHTIETNCSLQIILCEKEIQQYTKEISKDFFLYESIIPISRVCKIFFKDPKQAETTVWDINNTRAFIPNDIIKIDSNEEIDTSQIKNILIDNQINNDNLIDKYDRLLGGFALMRLGKDEFMNYPINYFFTISNISNPIKEELFKVDRNILNLMENKYRWLLLNDEIKFKNLYSIIYSKINQNIFDDFAKSDNAKYQMKLGKIVLDSIDKKKNTYLIAILASYDNKGTRRTLDNFISDLVQNKFPVDRKEGISLMFGINKGYSAFRNYYKTNNFTAIVKFKLDNILDYYIIESVYQYVTNLNLDINLYLSSIQKNKITVDKENYYSYSLFGNDIIYAEKEKKTPWYKRLFFSDLKKIWINNFENQIGIKLNEEQIKIKSNELDELLIKPLNKLFESVEFEINSKVKAYISDKEKEINSIKNREQYIWKSLREINSVLFDKIDLDKDNILNENELNIYISKLKSTDNNPLIIDSINNHESEYKIKESDLNKISLDELKKKAKKLGIKNISKYKKDNKYQLIKFIIEEEKNRENFIHNT